MVICERFELVGVAVEDEECRTFTAREIPSGRAVLVHQILEPPSGSKRPPLKDLVERCRPGRGPVIETCSSEGVDYVVTEGREGFRGLRDWLEAAAAVPAPPERRGGEDRFTRVGAWRVPAGLPTPTGPADPGGLSVSGIFSAPPKDETPRSRERIGPKPDQAGPEVCPTSTNQLVGEVTPASPLVTPDFFTASPPPADAPGEFTQMFRPPAPEASEASAPPVASPELAAPPAPSAPAESGEFTRMFQAPGATATPAPRPAASDPGAFTQLFQAKGAAGPAQPSLERAGLRSAPPPAPEQPGEFTRYFQSASGSVPFEESRAPAPTAAPAPPPPAAPPPGEYTRLFQMPAPASSPSAGSGATHVFVTPSVPSPQPPVQIEQGPGEFTRVIQVASLAPAEGKPQAAPEQPGPPASQPVTRKPAIPVGLIVLFACLAVLAIAMILYFALRR